MPSTITYQGKLSDSGGAPVTGTVDIVFTIYDAAAAGNTIWQETHTGVSVTNGIFTVELGSGASPIDASDFDAADRWLGVKVDLDPEMTPRQKLTSVAYAMQAEKADFADAASSVDWADVTSVPSTLNSLSCASNQIAKWNGSAWVCTTNSGADTLAALSCGSDQVAKWNGSAWACSTSVALADAASTADWAFVASSVDWADVTSVPGGLDDGDDDTVGALSCALNQIAKWNGSAWVCTTNSGADTLAALSCASDEVAQWNGAAWVCSASVALADAASSVDWADVTSVPGGLDDGDDDAVGALSCALNQIAKWNGSAWVCTTNSGADTLAALSCASNQIAKWNGSAWVCTTNSGADTLAGLSCGTNEVPKWNGAAWVCSVELFDAPSSVDWAILSTTPVGLSDGDDDTLAALSCASGEMARWSGTMWLCYDRETLDELDCDPNQVARWNGSNWTCSDDDTLSGLSCASNQTAKWNGSAWVCSVLLVDAPSSVDWAVLGSVPSGLSDGDDDTTYTAGTGLTLTSTEFSVDNPLSLSGMTSGGIITGTNSAGVSNSSGLKGVHIASSGATSGVYGTSASSSGYGVYGTNSSTGYAGYFEGDVNITGTISKGSGTFVQPHAGDPASEIQYAFFEGPEHAVFFRGTARLTYGVATIELPEHFSIVAASEGVQVQLTPHSADTFGLAAIERSSERIVVKEFKGGKGDFEFDYFVTAVRAGFEAHNPVIANKHFKPKPYETVSDFEKRFERDDLTTRAIRKMLISNGILTEEGKLNMAMVEKLGWTFVKEDSIDKDDPTFSMSK